MDLLTKGESRASREKETNKAGEIMKKDIVTLCPICKVNYVRSVNKPIEITETRGIIQHEQAYFTPCNSCKKKDKNLK